MACVRAINTVHILTRGPLPGMLHIGAPEGHRSPLLAQSSCPAMEIPTFSSWFPSTHFNVYEREQLHSHQQYAKMFEAPAQRLQPPHFLMDVSWLHLHMAQSPLVLSKASADVSRKGTAGVIMAQCELPNLSEYSRDAFPPEWLREKH